MLTRISTPKYVRLGPNLALVSPFSSLFIGYCYISLNGLLNSNKLLPTQHSLVPLLALHRS
ncbi:hypothetical protein M747DRAFT_146856 [Aspergillus niger ATCC 13496]|uniref:Uncharacterized protein n=1 Tax=Aspergillus niger ATCC 13496 TaxID=1353008 RepID=A0A370BLN1_ASPNG|nr:hypothetical protein M747DRAFT_146856 [Aspergillus niger ATCC 13496]